MICKNCIYHTHCDTEFETISQREHKKIMSCKHFKNKSDVKQSELKPCNMCLNARLDDELTDKNDLSYFFVGESAKGFRMTIGSGGGKPLRIDIEMWDEQLQENKIIGRYYPKFCPNCGRPIIEYEEDKQCD